MYQPYRNKGNRMVITGAASGLGRSIAVVFARQKWTIGVADINIEGAEETLRMIREAGGGSEVYKLDVCNPQNIEDMAGHFFDKWGGVDLLVNNAGIAVAGQVGKAALEDWERIMKTNTMGMLYGCHSFIPRMMEQGGGHIVNVSSAAGMVSLPEMAPYNVSKAAIISLSETLKSELAPHNIAVTVLCPTFFNTNLGQDLTYTDDFQKEFSEAAFQCAKITSEQVAQALFKAVKKQKLYCLPQFSARLQWILKRLNPSLYHGIMARLIKKEKGRDFVLSLARKGWV